MKAQDLKTNFKYEFKIKDSGYFTLILNDSSDNWENTKTVFDLEFCLNFKTFVFCNRSVKDGYSDFEITKIITFDFNGTVFEFKTIEEFISHIKLLDKVIEIHPFGNNK